MRGSLLTGRRKSVTIYLTPFRLNGSTNNRRAAEKSRRLAGVAGTRAVMVASMAGDRDKR